MDFTPLFSKQTSAFQSPALRQITLEVQKVNGINLGQGVCNLPTPEKVLAYATKAAQNGINRYTNPRGLDSLRIALAGKLQRHNNITANPETEILVTCGATGAFEAVCGTLLDPGDEVIVFEPSYPYHIQALKRYQASIKVVPLPAPHWEVDFELLRAHITPKTKFVLLNTPGNPTGKVWTREELINLAAILEPTNTLLVTDEIYEYMVFDGASHLSPASLPELAPRTITMGGYSKTFSITGWRIGYLVAPAPVASLMTAFLDAVYVCPPAPLQQAVADGVGEFPDDFYNNLRDKYQAKRDAFIAGLTGTGFQPFTPAGAYYLLADYSALIPSLPNQSPSNNPGMDFVMHLIHSTGVGAVPASDFVGNPAQTPWIRFCLASEDAILTQALQNLRSLV